MRVVATEKRAGDAGSVRGKTRKRLWNLASLWTRRAPDVGHTPADPVHCENKWRLLRYRPRPEGIAFETPVLLVPSLINRHYVLDLMTGKSFAEYLVAQGHDVYLIDWGKPGDEDRYLSFDDYCDRYLGRAVRRAARGSQRGQVHLLGYCLGGTLAAIYAAARPEHVASLMALAAPVSFVREGLLSAWTCSPTFDVGSLARGLGNVPWPIMQAAFHMLRPTLPLLKAVQLVDRAWEKDYLDGVLALETWSNDNVSLPGECFRRFVEDLVREDRFAKGTFLLSGRPAHPERITCPTLVISFEHDTIVPAESAAALIDLVGATDKERIHLPGGHVGSVVSRRAAAKLWPRLSGWWAARDGRPSSAEA